MAKSGGSYRWLPDEGGGGSSLGVREIVGVLAEVIVASPTHKIYKITRELLLEGEGEKTLTVHLMKRCGEVWMYIENNVGDLISEGDDCLLIVSENGKEYCQVVVADEGTDEWLKRTPLSWVWMNDAAHVFG